jgi:hypothetical protein
MDDGDGQRAGLGMTEQLGANDLALPNQQDFNVKLAGGEDGAFDFRHGSAIGTHGIDSNGDRHGEKGRG